MRKMISCLAMGILTVIFLTACGGGSGSSSGVILVSGSESTAKHEVELIPGSNVPNKLRISLAVENGEIIHLARNGIAAKLKVSDCSRILVEGIIIGWEASSGGKSVTYANPAIVEGVALSDVILVTVVAKDGSKYFLNPDHATFIGARSIIKDGLLRYGSAVDDPNFTTPSQPITPPVTPPVIPPVTPVTPNTNGQEPRHSFSVSGTTATVTFATVDGFIVNLAKDVNGVGVPASLAKTEVKSVSWNGDVAGWSLTGQYSLSTPALPTFTIHVPTHDTGIIRIVSKANEVYSIATQKTTLGSGMVLDGRLLISF